MDDGTAHADDTIAASAADTTGIPDMPPTEIAELAWSCEDDEPAVPRRSLRPLLRWCVAVAAVWATATAATWLGTVFYHEEEVPTATAPTHRAPTAAPVPAPPAAVLGGTYRVEVDLAKETANGAPNPPSAGKTDIGWWAFRSSCASTGCVATGTQLDNNNHQMAFTPTHAFEFHFINGHWQRTPVQTQQQYPHCLGADGKSIVARVETRMVKWSLEPQPDGTLRGVVIQTVLTNECGGQGKVFQAPFVATRMGDVPIGVSVADPATVPASPTTSTPTPVVGGPVLDGTYRLDFDMAKQTANGDPTTKSGTQSQWWAYRSLCTSSGCVATAAQLDYDNHQEPMGALAGTLYFIDGQWQWDHGPSIQSISCSATNQTQGDTDTVSWSLEPQPDGTLRGFSTLTSLTNGCGDQGTVFRTPCTATRTGDVPPGVILADPALFMAAPAPPTTPPRAGG